MFVRAPGDLLPGIVSPPYLGAADLGWLEELLAEAERFRGSARVHWETRLREPFFSAPVPPWKVRIAGRVLLALGGDAGQSARRPRAVRRVVFAEAARGGTRAEVLGRSGAQLALAPEALEEALFADLPSRRPFCPPPIGAPALAEEINLSLVQGLLARTRSVRIHAAGGAGDLVRHARREGLLCAVRQAPEPDGALLELSGPLALFGSTAVYARALAGLVPRLAWCRGFRLEASHETERGSLRTVLVRSGDPIASARGPIVFDRALDRRFERDLEATACGWDFVAAPEPVCVGGQLVFADFALARRERPEDRWLVEIVGLWTPGSIGPLLERLAAVPRLVLCVDERRARGDLALPTAGRVVRFRYRVDPREVLRVMDAAS